MRRHADRVPASAYMVVAYVVAACAVMSQVWAHPTSTLAGGNDGFLFTWFLGWTPHALAHGINPLVTHALNSAHPVNLMWNTLAPMLGVVAAPVTWLFGPVASVNLLMTAAIVANASAAWWVLRRWAGDWPAFVGGLIYGFGPYVIGASLGHLNLAFVPLPWVMLALGDDLMIRGRSARRCGLLLGLVVTVQALISEEVLATSAVVAAVWVGILVLLRPRQSAARVRQTLIGLGIAAATAATLLAWPLYTQFAGPARVHGMFPHIFNTVADLLGPITPGKLQYLSTSHTRHVVSHFPANGSESTTYLGLPLLLTCVFVGWYLRKHLLILSASIAMLTVSLLALGSHLHVSGHDTGIILPWRIFATLPVLENAVPVRLSVFVALFVAVIAAVALSAASLRRAPRWAVCLGLIVILGPLLPVRVHGEHFSTPRFFTSAHDLQLVDAHRPVLLLPIPYPGDALSMAWQAESNYRFPIVAGYVVTPNAQGRPQYGIKTNSFEEALLKIDQGQRSSWTSAELSAWRGILASMKTGDVILGPSSHQPLLDLLIDKVTGHDGSVTDGVNIWRMP